MPESTIWNRIISFYTKYFLERVDTTTNLSDLRSISETGCAREPSGGHTAVFPAFLCRSSLSVVIGFRHKGEVQAGD